MRRLINSLTILAASVATAPAFSSDVGVSIGINQPSVYGRIDIGRVPAPPMLIYQQPVVIMASPVAIQRQPIYMHVPPGHAKKWKSYSGRYQACGQPVYFVQDGWYRDVYVPVQYGERGDRYDKHERKEQQKQWKEERKHQHKHDKKDKHDH